MMTCEQQLFQLQNDHVEQLDGVFHVFFERASVLLPLSRGFLFCFVDCFWHPFRNPDTHDSREKKSTLVSLMVTIVGAGAGMVVMGADMVMGIGIEYVVVGAVIMG
jgi:hypothetical protein